MDGYFVYEYMLSSCLVSYMVYRWLFSDPMLCLESLQLFIGLNGDLQAVVFKDLAHFFFLLLLLAWAILCRLPVRRLYIFRR